MEAHWNVRLSPSASHVTRTIRALRNKDNVCVVLRLLPCATTAKSRQHSLSRRTLGCGVKDCSSARCVISSASGALGLCCLESCLETSMCTVSIPDAVKLCSFGLHVVPCYHQSSMSLPCIGMLHNSTPTPNGRAKKLAKLQLQGNSSKYNNCAQKELLWSGAPCIHNRKRGSTYEDYMAYLRSFWPLLFV